MLMASFGRHGKDRAHILEASSIAHLRVLDRNGMRCLPWHLLARPHRVVQPFHVLLLLNVSSHQNTCHGRKKKVGENAWRSHLLAVGHMNSLVQNDSPMLLFAVTSSQIERLWSRFTSLDKQQKGYLTREDFLRIPELAINPLGDRIVHAFFRDSSRTSSPSSDGFGDPDNGDGSIDGAENGETEVVNFRDFVHVLAHFRPLKKKAEKNKMNSREEKLRCE
jgi:hypothetical protein